MFADFDEALQEALEQANISTPTPVQNEVFPQALDGHDLFVCAQTGTGKTLAYLLPTLERLIQPNPKRNEQGIQALIVVPTRELAQQVYNEVKRIGRQTNVIFGHIGGGTDIHLQNEHIDEPPNLVVATPGRLLKLLDQELLDISDVEVLVLDEADRLIDMGMGSEVTAIANYCPGRDQTMLVSATLASGGLGTLSRTLLDEPVMIQLADVSDEHELIEHQVVYSDDPVQKVKQTIWLLENLEYKHAIVFCNSKERANFLWGMVHQEGIDVGILHGDRDQKQRNHFIGKLRRGELKVLIATDIAARGLDVDGMGLVINDGMPKKGDLYIHRVGRTGRAGEKGLAISLISASEYNLMASIERYLKQRFKRTTYPEIAAEYKGPKKLKASGKAAGTKKKKDKGKGKDKKAKVKKKKK